MFGECHGHIFMNGVDYKKAVSMYAHGVDREDVKRKLAVYRDRRTALTTARLFTPFIKTGITVRLWAWDLTP